MEKDPWKELAERIVLASALTAVALFLAGIDHVDAYWERINWLVACLVALFALCFGVGAAWSFMMKSAVTPWLKYPVALFMALAIAWFTSIGMLGAYFSHCSKTPHSSICSSS